MQNKINKSLIEAPDKAETIQVGCISGIAAMYSSG